MLEPTSVATLVIVQVRRLLHELHENRFAVGGGFTSLTVHRTPLRRKCSPTVGVARSPTLNS